MSSALNLTVPDEFDEWPHDARSFVLAEANTAMQLRQEIHALAGIGDAPEDASKANAFSKEQMATLVMALGGPQGVDD